MDGTVVGLGVTVGVGTVLLLVSFFVLGLSRLGGKKDDLVVLWALLLFVGLSLALIGGIEYGGRLAREHGRPIDMPHDQRVRVANFIDLVVDDDNVLAIFTEYTTNAPVTRSDYIVRAIKVENILNLEGENYRGLERYVNTSLRPPVTFLDGHSYIIEGVEINGQHWFLLEDIGIS